MKVTNLHAYGNTIPQDKLISTSSVNVRAELTETHTVSQC